LVAKHWQLPPPELAAAVWRALPNIAVDEIEAELRRQAEASECHARGLDVMVAVRPRTHQNAAQLRVPRYHRPLAR
jgi:hypothetical protein